MPREKVVNRLTTAVTRDENGLIIGSDAKVVRFLNPLYDDSTQVNIPGTEDTPAKCVVSASSMHGEIGTLEITDLAQFLIKMFPKEVAEAISLTLTPLKRYGVSIKKA